jgi:hypothetical protein
MRLPIAFALLMLAGPAAADYWDRPPIDYACRDGLTRSVVYRADGNYAWVSVAGAPPVELPATPWRGPGAFGTAHFRIASVPNGILWQVFRAPPVVCDGAVPVDVIVRARG